MKTPGHSQEGRATAKPKLKNDICHIFTLNLELISEAFDCARSGRGRRGCWLPAEARKAGEHLAPRTEAEITKWLVGEISRELSLKRTVQNSGINGLAKPLGPDREMREPICASLVGTIENFPIDQPPGT
jgi:hypothetical protein